MFETPLFLFAAVAGAMVPLILHLTQKWRSQPIYFPTIRFLRLAQHAAARRIRLQNVLLWFMRTMIMLLLGVAFAMPVIRTTGGGMLGRAARDVGIVLDMSYTMHYETGEGTAFDLAVEGVLNMIATLSEDDRYFIILAAREPSALIPEPIRDKDVAIEALGDLEAGYEPSALFPAIGVARHILAEHTGRRLQELHIFTDNRKQAWSGIDTARAEDARAEDAVSTFVYVTGVEAPQNIAPLSLELEPPLVTPSGGNMLHVEVGSWGVSRETVVQFFVAEQEQARRAVWVDPHEQATVSFRVPSLAAGTYTARVETPEDNLSVDNALHFLLRVGASVPSLVVGTERQTLFLRAALRAAAGSEDAVTHIPHDQFVGFDIEPYGVVFICDALPVDGHAIGQLEEYIRAGGLLVIFPGARTRLVDSALRDVMPAVPEGIWQFDENDARQSLVWEQPEHPVLAGLDVLSRSPQITMQRAFVLENMHADAAVLLRLRNGLPLMVERNVGSGAVVLFAIGADRGWSNFPLTSYFLPVIAQLVDYSQDSRRYPLFVQSQRGLLLNDVMREVPSERELEDGQGRSVRIRHVQQDGKPFAYIESPLAPGMYYRRESDGLHPALAVNIHAQGMELDPASAPFLEQWLQPVAISHSWEAYAEALDIHRVGRSLVEIILWLVLLLVAIEFWFANYLVQRGEASNKVVQPVSGEMST